MSNSIPMKHVDKGWGWERWIVNSEKYCGKLLFFNKNKKCSWHYHKIKDEVFYVQSGRMIVRHSDQDDIEKCQTTILNPGDCLVHHCLTVHGSNKNRSNFSRKGFTFQFKNFNSKYDETRKKKYENSLIKQLKLKRN